MHRRRFLQLASVLALPLAAPPLGAFVPSSQHPTPRKGITAAKVLHDADVPKEARDAYAAAREFPALFDGIYCHCDCASRHDELRSLLSCYETRMPLDCGVCSGEGRLVGRLARQGKSLDEIRDAIDERYG